MDHLGNVRLSYQEKPDGRLAIVEENNYYPFGLRHTYYNDNLTGNKENNYHYKYQGQERQDELGLNWDSFKWRNYDYALGRFMNVDPLAETYNWFSPYVFSENRVIDSRELEGLERVWIADALHKDFEKVYDIQRKTSGGKEFTKALKSQNNYNVLYAPIGKSDFASGRTFEVNDSREWKINLKTYGLRLNENLYSIISENGEKDIIIITAGMGKIRNIYNNEKIFKSGNEMLFDFTTTWNHEEVAHALKILKGDSENAKDHLEYYGDYSTFSPKNGDVLKLDKYKGTKARQNFEEIKEIIDEKND